MVPFAVQATIGTRAARAMYPAGLQVRPNQRSRATAGTVGALGCVLAVAAGAAAASEHGILVAIGVIGLALCGVACAIYVRDPVYVFILLWLCVVFNPSLSAVVGYSSPAGVAVRQAFEIPIVLFIGLTAWRTVMVKPRRPPLGLVLPGIGVGLFGILSALLHDVPVEVAAIGAWLGLKLWLMIAITLLLPWRLRDVDRVYAVLIGVGLLVAALGIIDFLTNAAISGALHTSGFRVEVDRSRSVYSILTTPAAFSLFMSMLFAITYSRFALRHSRSDLALALLFAICAVLSLRLKGFLSVGVVVLVVAIVQSAMSNRRTLMPFLVGALLLVGAYSIQGAVIHRQITTYTSGDSPRAILYETGASIAADDFPLGVGFGRFGSYPSQMYYSPVYDQYEISGVFGLSRAYPEALLDASWASVLGETGVGGLVCFVAGLACLVASVVRQVRRAPSELVWLPVGALCMIAVLLVTSVGQGSLFDWLAVTTLALVVGPTLVAVASVAGPGGQTKR